MLTDSTSVSTPLSQVRMEKVKDVYNNHCTATEPNQQWKSVTHCELTAVSAAVGSWVDGLTRSVSIRYWSNTSSVSKPRLYKSINQSIDQEFQSGPGDIITSGSTKGYFTPVTNISITLSNFITVTARRLLITDRPQFTSAQFPLPRRLALADLSLVVDGSYLQCFDTVDRAAWRASGL